MDGVPSRVLMLLVASVIDTSTASISTERCPEGLPSTSSIKLYGDKCYQFVADERYWDEARDYCFEHNGRLVKVDSEQTNDFIVETLNSLWWQNNGVWIGLHDRNVEMSWQWVGMVPYSSEPVYWTNWGQGHPRAVLHSVRDCVRMVRGSREDWLWHETPCHLLNWKYRFICEYVASPAITTTTTTQSRPFYPQISSHRGVGRRVEHNNDILSYSRSLSKDDLPAHEAVVGSEPQTSSVTTDSKWLVVLLVVAIAAAIVVVVGVVLFRRKRNRKANLPLVESSSEFSDDSKPCSNKMKSSESLELPENNTLARQHGVTRAAANIYVSSGLANSRPSSGVYEDIGPVSVLKESHADEETLGNHSYLPMNGKSQKPLPPACSGYPLTSAHHSCDYLAMNDREGPEYKNCPIVNGGRTTGHSAAFRSVDIYSEIPETDDDIYESLEGIQA